MPHPRLSAPAGGAPCLAAPPRRGCGGRASRAAVAPPRLQRDFGRQVTVSALPYLPDVHRGIFGDSIYGGESSALNLVAGCVDNGFARRALAETLSDSAPSVCGS